MFAIYLFIKDTFISMDLSCQFVTFTFVKISMCNLPGSLKKSRLVLNPSIPEALRRNIINNVDWFVLRVTECYRP